MPASIDCSPACCATVPPVQVPGTEGDTGLPGTDGVDGVNAYTTTAVSIITLPAAAGPVTSPATQSFVSTLWMAVGQKIIISDPNGTDWGTFRVLTLPTGTTATLEWLDYDGDAAGLTPLAIGSQVSASGTQPVLAAPLPTALTDNSTGTASNTIAAGAGVQTIEIPHTFIGGTAAVESVTDLPINFKFKILSWAFVTEVLLVGAAGSRVANMEISGVDVGTVPSTITIPIANAAVGVVTAGTAVAGANTGAAGATLSIEIANGGTQFTAGSGTFIIHIQNMDTADAIASLADHVNDLIVSLT